MDRRMCTLDRLSGRDCGDMGRWHRGADNVWIAASRRSRKTDLASTFLSAICLIDELQDDGLYSDGRTAVVVPVMMN